MSTTPQELAAAVAQLRALAQGDQDPAVRQEAATAVRVIAGSQRGGALQEAIAVATDTGRASAVRQAAVRLAQTLILAELKG